MTGAVRRAPQPRRARRRDRPQGPLAATSMPRPSLIALFDRHHRAVVRLDAYLVLDVGWGADRDFPHSGAPAVVEVSVQHRRSGQEAAILSWGSHLADQIDRHAVTDRTCR